MRFSPKFNEYRTFGVELEFKLAGQIAHWSADQIANELQARSGFPVRFRGYTHEVTGSWKLVTDASVNGGLELVSPPLSGRQGLAQLRTVVEALASLGAKVDKSCGYHVHHDASDLNVDQLAGLIVFHTQFEKVIDQFHPMGRRQNGYCEGRHYPVEARTAAELRQVESEDIKRTLFERAYTTGASRSSRYRKLNLLSLQSYGTVEFRQHAGTLNADKVVNWLLFTQILVEKAKCGVDITPRAKVSFGELMRALRMHEATPELAHLRDFFHARMIALRREEAN